MKQIRKRLTYANVMSSIAVFLILGGATAIAAGLGKNTVGSKQLKKDAVTAAKIKQGAVTAAKLGAGAVGAGALANGSIDASKIGAGAVTGEKIANGSIDASKIGAGAVTGEKIANGSVTGANINAGSTPFSQVVARLRGVATLPFTAGQVYPFANPTYVQPPGEDDQFLGSLAVTFAASCVQPRQALAYLLLNPENPGSPTASDIVGYGSLVDKQSGTATRTIAFAPLTGAQGPFSIGTSAPQSQSFSVYLASSSCTTGTGVTATGAAVDVIGTK